MNGQSGGKSDYDCILSFTYYPCIVSSQTFSEIANIVHCGLASVQIISFIIPYMECLVSKVDQHAPCFAISEKAYAKGLTLRSTLTMYKMKDHCFKYDISCLAVGSLPS